MVFSTEEYRMDMVFFKAQADHVTIRPTVTLLIEGTCRWESL